MPYDLTTIADGISFAEGPRWHEGQFWFSDFYQHAVNCIGADGTLQKIYHVPQQPSGLGWRPDGSLLIVSMIDRALLTPVKDGFEQVADLSPVATSHCNDMVVDPVGRAYVGNFGFNRHAGEKSRSADLAMVDVDGTVSVAATDLAFPNGTVITPDGKRLIIGETRGRRLTSFDVALDGSLSNRQIFAQFDDVFPDGICLDAEGAIWVADAMGTAVLRVFEGGEIADRVDLGARHSYACMLGGADRKTLYICTNVESGPGTDKDRKGQIDICHVQVPGVGCP